MDQREIGRQRGREAAEAKLETLQREMEGAFRWANVLFPSLEGTDLSQAIRDYDAERLADEPDYSTFPEMRGLIDRHVGEREGFRDAGGDDATTAFHFSWPWFLWRRINAHHVPYWERVGPNSQCTNVFFPEGAEGITVSDNRDDLLRPNYYESIPKFRPPELSVNKEVRWVQGAASSGVVMDEEPECHFPCDPSELRPPECNDDLNAMIEFMTRYREFWGPDNQIWVDTKLNAVAVEKTNCRVAFHFPQVSGAVCITACSYLDPELHAFKQERQRKVMEAKGETEENNLDWHFDLGARERYQRLWELTNAEAARPGGATLWGALAVVADEVVPFPARICLAGQKTFADQPEREVGACWTITQHAGVITGPNRRWLYRSVQDLQKPLPVTSYTPRLMLGEGVDMLHEWQEDVDAGRCILPDDANDGDET